MEQCHDFIDLERAVSRYSDALVDFHTEGTVKKARKRFTIERKEKIRSQYKQLGSYAAVSRLNCCNESVVRSIVKSQKIPLKDSRGRIVKSKAFKGNKKGAGKKLSYPKSVDEELLQWVYVMSDQHMPCSTRLFRKKAKALIQPHNPQLKASTGWLDKFRTRNHLSLRKRTSLSQKLPEQLEEKIKSFYMLCAKAVRIGKYPLGLIGNMDETPMWFDIVPQKSLAKTGSK